MLDEKTILEETRDLEPKERAAALAHYIYTLTYRRMGPNWESRVPEEWADLSEDARQFNLVSAEMWAESRQVLDAWQEAIRAIELK